MMIFLQREISGRKVWQKYGMMKMHFRTIENLKKNFYLENVPAVIRMGFVPVGADPIIILSMGRFMNLRHVPGKRQIGFKNEWNNNDFSGDVLLPAMGLGISMYKNWIQII